MHLGHASRVPFRNGGLSWRSKLQIGFCFQVCFACYPGPIVHNPFQPERDLNSHALSRAMKKAPVECINDQSNLAECGLDSDLSCSPCQSWILTRSLLRIGPSTSSMASRSLAISDLFDRDVLRTRRLEGLGFSAPSHRDSVTKILETRRTSSERRTQIMGDRNHCFHETVGKQCPVSVMFDIY